MNAPEIAIVVGASLIIGALVTAFVGAWVIAIRDRALEGIIAMLIVTIIVGALLFAIGATA